MKQTLFNPLLSKGFQKYYERKTTDIPRTTLITLLDNGGLVENDLYRITDYSNNSISNAPQYIVLEAISTSKLSRLCYLETKVPDYQGVFGANSLGIWKSSLTTPIGSYVVWGGKQWINLTGSVGSATSNSSLDANWGMVTDFTDPIYMNVRYDISYDINENVIYSVRDEYGNFLTGSSYQQCPLGNRKFKGNIVLGDGSYVDVLNATRFFNDNLIIDSSVNANRLSNDMYGNTIINTSAVTIGDNATSSSAVRNIISATTIDIYATGSSIANTDFNHSSIIIQSSAPSSNVGSSSISGGAILINTNQTAISATSLSDISLEFSPATPLTINNSSINGNPAIGIKQIIDGGSLDGIKISQGHSTISKSYDIASVISGTTLTIPSTAFYAEDIYLTGTAGADINITKVINNSTFINQKIHNSTNKQIYITSVNSASATTNDVVSTAKDPTIQNNNRDYIELRRDNNLGYSFVEKVNLYNSSTTPALEKTIQTTGFTASISKTFYSCNGTFTVVLPPIATCDHPITIKNVGSGDITIDGDGAETIDGSATATILAGTKGSTTLIPNATEWTIN